MEDFDTFLKNYNNYYGHHDKITKEFIDYKLKTKVCSVGNMYDKISEEFPTIKRFIFDTYYKSYIKGKQVVIRKDSICSKCNNDFSHDKSIAFEDDKLIHLTCIDRINNNPIKDQMIELFNEHNICPLCNKRCQLKDQIVMDRNDFYHKKCYVENVRNFSKNLKCGMCNELLFSSTMNHKLPYCTKNDCDDFFHVDCAKKDEKTKYKKNHIHIALNKCSMCDFYVHDGKYFHNVCKTST